MGTQRQTTHDNITFPHGFLDFLRVSQGRRHTIGDYELEPVRLERFNRSLRELSPDAPAMTMDQIATAAGRALERHPGGGRPPFVSSRMASLGRLEAMAGDQGWGASDDLRRKIEVLRAYRAEPGDLIPDGEPVIGLLDDAVLVDVALQLLRDELGDYEDYCRFRRVAAEFSGLPEAELGLTREHWLEAMLQAQESLAQVDAPRRDGYLGDPRASLFHVT